MVTDLKTFLIKGVKSPHQFFFFYYFFHLFTLFKRILAPTSWSPMSKLFRFLESLEKSNEEKWSQVLQLLLIKGVKLPCKKVSFLDKFCLTSRIFSVSVLLSALVERFFVSCMHDFCSIVFFL